MITIKQLQKASPALQLKVVTDASGVNYQILRRKMKNSKELDLNESKQLQETLRTFGISLDSPTKDSAAQ
jgi:hypothetical protein